MASEAEVDYIENLFYQFKERYDILYICREEINGDLLYLVEEVFMEYCYGIFKRILSTLMTLEDELGGSNIFRRFKNLIRGIVNKVKKILVDLEENLILRI